MSEFKTRPGFTLLEAVVAMAVLLFGILAIARGFPLAMKISRSAEQATIAANLAQAEMEEAFYLGYDGLSIGTIETRHHLADETDNPFYYYERETAVAYVDQNLSVSATETGLKKITTTVYWRSPAFEAEKNTTLSLVISQK